MPRIALLGPGAIGGLVTAWLCQDKNIDVTVCVRTPIRRLRLDTPYGSIEAHPQVLTDQRQASPVDWIIVTTKAYDSENVCWQVSTMTGQLCLKLGPILPYDLIKQGRLRPMAYINRR